MDFHALLIPWLIWLLIGVALIFVELAMPGLIVIFFGIGALATSLALILWSGLSLNAQLVIFISASVISLIALRHWLKKVFYGRKSSRQSSDYDDSPVGLNVKVTRDITPHEAGRISYRGADWYATAEEDIAVGATVEIIKYADSSHQIFVVRQVH